MHKSLGQNITAPALIRSVQASKNMVSKKISCFSEINAQKCYSDELHQSL